MMVSQVVETVNAAEINEAVVSTSGILPHCS